MAKTGHYAHTDRQGRSVSDRLQELAPSYIGAVSENIAYMGGSVYHRKDMSIKVYSVAVSFMQLWLNSPGHRANILAKDQEYMGVGFADTGRLVLRNDRLYRRQYTRFYGTQVFGRVHARYLGKMPARFRYNTTHTLRFRYLGPFKRKHLSIFVDYPDQSYKHFVSRYTYFTGTAPYKPTWHKDGTFSIKIRFNKGRGTYTLSGSYDDSVHSGNMTITTFK